MLFALSVALFGLFHYSQTSRKTLLFPSSALIPYLMQIRRLGAVIGKAEGPITPGSTERKRQPGTGPVMGVIARGRKRLSRGLAVMKEIEERDKRSKEQDARFTVLNFAFFDKAALSRRGDRKRGFITCR